MPGPSISKTQYIKGLRCPKSLWLHTRGIKAEITPELQEIFEAGKKVGKLAQECFTNGIEVDDEYYEIDECVFSTEEFIRRGYQVIFEATAINPDNGCYSRIDILSKAGNGQWDMVEVKNSTSVKDYHFDDMAFQYHVFSAAGYNIRKCEIMHIDNSYVRQGEIEPEKMFKRQDISADVIKMQDSIRDKIENIIKIKNSSWDPKINIGKHCMVPFECEYKGHCWKSVPEYSAYNLFPKTIVDDIVNKYGIRVEELPEEIFPKNKLIDIECYLSNQGNVQIDEVSNFVSSLEYPLYFLDYETFAPAVPMFDGTRPYQKIPFQFSIHKQNSFNGELKHSGYLHKRKSDSRLQFVKRLISECEGEGSIIVYNKSFEASINNQLSLDFPEYAEEISGITGRMVDLLIPFKKRWLYDPSQNGSASIKSVLPAFTKLKYDDLDITSGIVAMRRYEAFIHGDIESTVKAEELWSELERYCKLDTFAMVSLLKVLCSYTDIS